MCVTTMVGVMTALHCICEHLIHSMSNPHRISSPTGRTLWKISSQQEHNSGLFQIDWECMCEKRKLYVGTEEKKIGHSSLPYKCQSIFQCVFFHSLSVHPVVTSILNCSLPPQKGNLTFMLLIHKPYVSQKAGGALFTCLALSNPTHASFVSETNLMS